jgi:hypothetical protein
MTAQRGKEGRQQNDKNGSGQRVRATGRPSGQKTHPQALMMLFRQSSNLKYHRRDDGSLMS